MPQCKRFIVRTNCEYSLEVEAGNEAEALTKAEKIDLADWETSWAEYEADKE